MEDHWSCAIRQGFLELIMPLAKHMYPNKTCVWQDVVSATVRDGYYMTMTLTCGHTVDISRYGYKKFHLNKDNAVGCLKCPRA